MNAGHEQRDVDVPSLFGVIIALLLSGALILAVVWGTMRLLAAKELSHRAPPQVAPRFVAGAFPAPRLEVRGSLALSKLRTREDALLNSYGWVNRSADVARVPIERAMELILERGLPDVGKGQTPLQLMQARPQQTTPSPANTPQ